MKKQHQLMLELTRFSMVSLNINEIADNAIQNSDRHKNNGSTSALEEELIKDNLRHPPTVTKEDGRWICTDGHRRIQALRSLGYKGQIDCVVDLSSNDSAEMKQAKSMKGIRRYTLGDHFIGWAKSSDRKDYLMAMARRSRQRIEEMVKTFGEQEAERLALSGVSPMVTTDIGVCHSFLAHWGLTGTASKRKMIGYWIIDHKGTTTVKALSHSGTREQARRLAKCIEENKPFKKRRYKIKAEVA